MILVHHRLMADGSAYEIIGLIEDAYSVVWTERWQDYGEAQVEMPPHHDIATGDLLTMPGRDMAVEVVAVTVTERSIEARCRDALSILDRRIVYPSVKNNGSVATFITKLLQNDSIVTDGTTHGDRTLRPLRIGGLSVATASASLQRSYSHVGESLLELGRVYGFDPTATLSRGLLTIGARANTTRRVWGVGNHLSSYSSDEDIAESKNIAYVAGQTYEGERETWVSGDTLSKNLDRREMYVDRRDIATRGLSLEDAVATYGEIDSVPFALLRVLRWQNGDDIPEDEEVGNVKDITLYADIYFEGFGAEVGIGFRESNPTYYETLKQEYTPALWYDDAEYFGEGAFDSDGNLYWHFDMDIYYHPDRPPTHKTLDLYATEVIPYVGISMSIGSLFDPIGEEALADLQPRKVLEARLEGLTPYTDYALGDTCTIFLSSGTRASGIVAEIVESWDSQGYRADPTLRMDAV